MSDLKETLTKIFLSQAAMPTDDVTVKKYMLLWWKNCRQKLNTGLCLTEAGYDFLNETLKLKSYVIPFPKDFTFTNQIILFMDQYVDCPHFYTKKSIIVFKESKACELLLFSGDLRKYGTAKAMARQRELNSL
jgi:hypothetical protein